MDKYIILSKSVLEFLSPEITGSSGVTVISDVRATISGIQKNAQGGNKGRRDPAAVLLFLHPRDYEAAGDYLQGLSESEVVYRLVFLCTEGEIVSLDGDRLQKLAEFRTTPMSLKEYHFLVSKTFFLIEDYHRCRTQDDEHLVRLMDMKQDQEALINIGRSLSTEKDPDKLLRLILFLSKKITGADAGSIFLIEEIEDGRKQLRFKYSHTFSKDLPYEEFVLPYSTKSIAGYVAVTGKVLNIPDCYRLPHDAPVGFNSSFDKDHDYHSKSMLVVPMKNHIDEVIGVIQLINSKEDIGGKKGISGNEAFEIVLSTPEDFETKVGAFDANYEDLMVAVANQAAIAIENNRMIKQIQNQFEEFVKASVIAIESRDIATSGHSFRVAEICIAMARAINDETEGEFRNMHFTETEIKELEYAALLHDFGKVYIDLAIFIKGKKLYPKEFENLVLKLNYLYRYIEHDYFQKETALMRGGGGQSRSEMQRLEAEKEGKLGRIVKIKEKITLLNEPLVTEGDPDQMLKEILDEIERIECLDMEGSRIEIITESEKANLRIKRGSLNPAERREIESHVVHTYNFVSRIPWPPEFKRIPEIVLEHHEKLDGTGYPNGIKGKTNISLQARMMTIADVFDALVARDRPYKKSIPLERALAILEEDSRNNKIDRDLLDIFIKRRIFEQIDKNSYKKE